LPAQLGESFPLLATVVRYTTRQSDAEMEFGDRLHISKACNRSAAVKPRERRAEERLYSIKTIQPREPTSTVYGALSKTQPSPCMYCCYNLFNTTFCAIVLAADSSYSLSLGCSPSLFSSLSNPMGNTGTIVKRNAEINPKDAPQFVGIRCVGVVCLKCPIVSRCCCLSLPLVHVHRLHFLLYTEKV